MEDVPRDGREVWLLVTSYIEMPVDEIVVGRWDAHEKRWIGDHRFGWWKRYDSDARGWAPLEAPRGDKVLRKGIRRRWQGAEDDLRQRFGEAE
jgi:hypothetical protein